MTNKLFKEKRKMIKSVTVNLNEFQIKSAI